MANEPKVLQVNQDSGTETTYVSGGMGSASVGTEPRVLGSQTESNSTISGGSGVASASVGTEAREISRNEDVTETIAGESESSEAVVATEARESVAEETESNINMTNVRGVATGNTNERSLRVAQDYRGGHYERNANSGTGFERSKGDKNIVNTITVDEVKALIKKYGGNPNVYTKEQIDEMLETIREGQYVKVDTTEYATLEAFLASEGEQGTVYLYPVGNEENNYYQYIWEVSEWVSLGTTALDLSGYPQKNADETISGEWTFNKPVKADNTFNVINASDIVNNTLTQAHLDLITNGKITRIIGGLYSYPYVILYPPTDRSGADTNFIGKCLVQSNGQSWQETNYKIVKSTKVITFTTTIGFSCESNETRILGLKRVNGVNIPAYPSSPTVPQALIYDTDNTLKYVDTPNKNISDAYDNTKTYAVGDTCIYNNVLYKCTTAITTAENFDATHWTATTVAELVADETIIRFNTAFSVENTWTEITDSDDLAILEHDFTFNEQAKVDLVITKLTADDKNIWGSKMFAFGGNVNSRDKHLRTVRYDYYSANGSHTIVIQFYKQNDVWGYNRKRHYW